MRIPNPESRGMPVNVPVRLGSDLDDELIPRLDNRGRPYVVKRDLKRYYGLLAELRSRLPVDATEAYDVLREEVFTREILRHLPAILDSAGVSAPFSDLHESYALADAVEQVRSASWPELEDTIPERLRKLGLIRAN